MKDIKGEFISRYGIPEVTVRSAGRANIIGEHTDYNNGFVLPFAIDRGITFYAGRNDLNTIYAADLDETHTFLPDVKIVPAGWTSLYAQVLRVVEEKYNLAVRIAIVFGGDLPIGAGISSSSALCCGWLTCISELYNLECSNDELVSMASQAENGTGVNGGKMDQYTIINGQHNRAMLIDCNSYTHQDIMLPLDWKWVLLHSGVTHNLVETGYNDRRTDCESAVSKLQESGLEARSLREVSVIDLEAIRSHQTLFRRARYVVEENERVQNMVQAISHHDIKRCGALLYESHLGLSQDYEVSCEELDSLVELTQDCCKISGSRMMGGGFGGCTINLIRGDGMADIAIVRKSFADRYGYMPKLIEISPSVGISSSKMSKVDL